MLILVDLVQTHVFYLISSPTSMYIHELIYKILILIPYTFINYNNSTSRIDIFWCQNHSIELWIIVTLFIIICFLIMFN